MLQIFVTAMLKAKLVCLIGLDLAYRSDRSLKDTNLARSLDMKTISRHELMQFYRREINPFGNDVITDYVKETYRDINESWLKRIDLDIFQCSEFTVLHPDNFKLMTFKEFLEKLNA